MLPDDEDLQDDDDKPKKPRTDFGYALLIIIAILVAYFVIYPIGLKVAGVFQTLTDAFANRK